MSKIISETSYGRREPPWLLESPKEQRSHFDQRGCVRQIQSSSQAVIATQSKKDLPASRPRASYFLPEQSQSGRTPHRLAYVYNATPAVTHQTATNASFTVPIIEFMVPLCCGKCEEKVTEALENDEGVYKVVCDLYNQRVTVSSDQDPNRLLQRIKRIKKNAHFWRGSTPFKGAHYVTTSFPGSRNPSHHHSQTLPQQHAAEIRESPSAHHQRTSPPHNPRYVAPRSPYQASYDHGVAETQYLKRINGDREYNYYTDAEYPYKSSESPYKSPFGADLDNASALPYDDSLHHAHLGEPSSYTMPYEMEEYALHLKGYY